MIGALRTIIALRFLPAAVMGSIAPLKALTGHVEVVTLRLREKVGCSSGLTSPSRRYR